jgi:hypothetical protein
MPRPTSQNGSRPTQRPYRHPRRVNLLINTRSKNHEREQPEKDCSEQGPGASGLLGVAAIEKFLAAGWKVVGVSRRKPELPSGRDVEFLSVDLRDEEAARAAFEPLTDITHIAYTALHEKPELVAGWSSREQIETNNAMLRNVVEPIVRVASHFQYISILQGTKIYGVHLRPIPIPARENDARKDHQNFFFDQEAYVREMGAQHGFNYTALRPQLVTGPTPVALNVAPPSESTRQSAARRVNRSAFLAVRRSSGKPPMPTSSPT